MIIKILLILGIASAALFALRGTNSSTHLAVRRLFGAGFVVVAGASVVFPDLVTWLANRVGVATGTNLVLYALVVVFLFTTIGLHQRIHLLERRLTQISREFTLWRAHVEGQKDAQDADQRR